MHSDLHFTTHSGRLSLTCNMKVIEAVAPPSPVIAAPPVSERTRLLLEGPILPTLLRLALPNIVVVVVQATSSAVDAFYLGRLGSDVLAGVALVFPVRSEEHTSELQSRVDLVCRLLLEKK